jgi:hypothetical protein
LICFNMLGYLLIYILVTFSQFNKWHRSTEHQWARRHSKKLISYVIMWIVLVLPLSSRTRRWIYVRTHMV